jgi:hypothetical protein
MCHIGAHFAHDVLLLTKLVRVLSHFLRAKTADVLEMVPTLIARVVLPALTVATPNPALGFEIWQVCPAP